MVKQKHLSKDSGSSTKNKSKNTSFGKSILNGFRNTFGVLPSMYNSTGSYSKKKTLIMPTAIGGTEQQSAFLISISDASNSERIDLICQLKKSIEDRSVSSIMESWIPVSGIFYQIKGEKDETSLELRQALTDLLHTCINRDDLSQEGIVLRYLHDILVFCEITTDSYDPCIETFLKCLYQLIENDRSVDPLLIEFSIPPDDSGDSHDNPLLESLTTDQILTSEIKYSLENFILSILSCNYLLTTAEGINIVETFVNKLTIYTENGTFKFLDFKLVSIIIKLLFFISLELENIQSFEQVLINILSFIKALLLHASIPIGSLPLIMIMFFHLYSEGAGYQSIIEYLFARLMENEATCDICYEIMLEFIQTVNINDYLNYKDYDLNDTTKEMDYGNYPTEIISFRDLQSSSDKIHYRNDDFNNISKSAQDTENKTENPEILYRLTKVPLFSRKRRNVAQNDPIEVSTQILFGILNLMSYVISKDNFKVLRAVEKKEFIFDISSYKFQSLVNALYNRLNLQSNYNDSKPDVNVLLKSFLKPNKTETFDDSIHSRQGISKNSQILVYRSVLYFIFFLLKTKVVFLNTPEHLFFYQKSSVELLNTEEDDDLEISLNDPTVNEILSKINSSEIGDDIDNYTILDILDDTYSYFFADMDSLKISYPHLFKDKLSYKDNVRALTDSYKDRALSILTTDEPLLFDIIETYHSILDHFQLYSEDSNLTVKLSLMNTSEYFLTKSNMLTFSNWKYVFSCFSQASISIIGAKSNIKSIQAKIFSESELGKLISLSSLSKNDIVDLKILSLKALFDFLTNHFDFTSHDECEDSDNNYWKLLNYLFGTNDNSDDNYFKSELDSRVTDYLSDCLGYLLCLMSLSNSKKLLHEYLFKSVFRMDTYDCSDISAKVLLQVTRRLIQLFITSCINDDNIEDSSEIETTNISYINDRRDKVLLFYESILTIGKVCTKYFINSSTEDIHYDDMFELFFFVIDFFSRIRATEDGFIYFDNRTREFKIIMRENRKGGTGNEVNYLVKKTKEYLEDNQIMFAEELSLKPSTFVKVLDGFPLKSVETVQVDINKYLDISIDLISDAYDFKFTLLSWYLLILQLANMPLFINSIEKIKLFRSSAVNLMQNSMKDLKFYTKENNSSSITIRDKVTLQRSLIRLMIRLLMYSKYFSREEQSQLVHVISLNLDNFENLGILSIHALSVCCYQIPNATTKYIQSIIFKLQQHISNMDAVPHILEFLLTISHLPELTKNFGFDDYKYIFGMSFRFIQSSIDIQDASNSYDDGSNLRKPLTGSERLSNYYSSLSFNIVSSWFIEMNMSNRKKLAPYIIKCLVDLSGEKNKDVDARCAVLVDFIQRFTFTNVDLRFKLIKEILPKDSDIIDLGRWILGISIISVLTNRRNGISIVNIRRPTGTTKFELKPHQSMVPMQNISEYSTIGYADDGLFTSNYIFSQILAHIFTDTDRTPMKIPPGKEFSRSVELFDKKPLVEVYKAGLIYIAPGQTTEKEVLSNTVGSRSYQRFLSRIGDLIHLKNNTTYYTAGLNAETDGEFAYCWDAKVFQLTFHTTTLMPSTNDCSLTFKKSHIGNDFVNIYFDESGKPFNFNIIPSQFTFVNIVISPVSIREKKYSSPFNSSDLAKLLVNTGTKNKEILTNLNLNTIDSHDDDDDDDEFFQIHTYLRPGLPEVFSTCRTKTISSKKLPCFIRTLALIATQFAKIWNSDNPVNENIWADRYFAILQLKRRVQKFYEEANNSNNKNSNSNNNNNIPANLKNKLQQSDHKAELIKILDFTGYT